MNNQRWLSFSFLTFFFTWGIFLPYWTGWLTIEKGLSVTSASIVMGAGMMARSFSTFFLFPAITKRFSLSRVIKLLAFLSLGLALLYFISSTFAALLIITVLLSLVYPIIMPAIESSASLLMQTEKIHYGKSRAYGSAGYTVALLMVGATTSFWNEQAILYVMLFGLATICLFSLQPTPSVLRKEPDVIKVTQKGDEFKELFLLKPFVTVLILSVLLQGAHASYYNYGYIFLDDLGVNSFYIGIILNIAVLFEIIFFARADKLLANMKVSTMFIIAALGSTMRWTLIFLFPTSLVFIATQVFHMISFGIAHYAFIRYISEKLPTHLIATAQGIYASFAMSLSIAILTFVGGRLYDIAPNLAFLGMLISTVPAIFIVFATRKRFSY